MLRSFTNDPFHQVNGNLESKETMQKPLERKACSGLVSSKEHGRKVRRCLKVVSPNEFQRGRNKEFTFLPYMFHAVMYRLKVHPS